ncbi:bifunctional enoyl-CoA hydratase/phosphate acetyltransferase [Candidatus Xianfuyuplasma coldseepsis]|uniref:Bifunctional enoyl-CoA hydratase/phosphate acetyltransferase n=1 Tax=Candidatus Xianfuyuplasma coldseepsis TaxID=2782163 RepID=A0A7L7KUR5_9MOLU|nr:bifunctional enoyl-CoA hydratase/phosphate acetyltransferase [Xianfuyuplasma coldseepsis]
MHTMHALVEQAKTNTPPTLVVACAADEHVLTAVHKAAELSIVTPILIGDKEAIQSLLQSMDITNHYDIIDEGDDKAACEKAVRLVHDHPHYVLMKGLVATSTILRAALDKEFGLRTRNRISHVSLIEVPDYPKLLMMSDGAMNIAPTLDEKRQIIENAVGIAHAIGLEQPHVGIIGAVEKVNPQMNATLDAEKLVQMNQEGTIKNCIVGGPFAIDNAVNKEAALHKGITDPIAGEVDILIMPRIEAGNVFYKTLMFLGKAKSASVIAGATHPIVLTSRADSAESKLYSIALAALVVTH